MVGYISVVGWHGKAWRAEATSWGWRGSGQLQGLCGGKRRVMLNGGEPSPPKKGLPRVARSQDVGKLREAGQRWSCGREGGGHAYPPPPFRCGHKEGTPGPPARRKVGWMGGVPLQSYVEMCVAAGLPPLHVSAKTAPMSTGGLSELAGRSLWREGPVKAPLGTRPELTVGKTM